MNFKQPLYFIGLIAVGIMMLSFSCSRRATPAPANDTASSQTITVKGVLVPGGAECPRFKGEDDQYYTLAGGDKLNGFKEGDSLVITGTRAETSFCMQDIVLDVSQATKLSESSLSPTPVPAPKPNPPVLDSGISGTMAIGPTCPVQRDPPDPGCDDQPYQGTVVIKSSDGREVGRITADSKGMFKIALASGKYTVEPINSKVYPRASAQPVEVTPHVFAKVTIQYDSGIR